MVKQIIYNRVNEILKKDYFARISDAWLYLRMLINLGLAKKIKDRIIIELKNVENLVPPDSIRRTRQKIQNEEGRYLPEDRIVKKRQIHAKEKTIYYSNKQMSEGMMANSQLW